ncbi:DUF309 domain-containing protein [Candidatus Amarolinea dominans]|uniref:DUF309 domain-containing protein n=1 Tax=Candidatus Amarolinea dominans TaxID=3140696 RepID=UPI0031CC532E
MGAIGRWPALVLIDMTAPGDWLAVVRRAKNLPHTRLIPIVAFGSHVKAGADRGAAGRLRPCLGQVAPRAGNCPRWSGSIWRRYRRRSKAGTPPGRAGVAGFEAFNAGHYWEQHELLEGAWREEARPVRELYQGILQVGVALHQIEQGKWAGASNRRAAASIAWTGCPRSAWALTWTPFAARRMPCINI